jgi:hypothetical protein
MKLSSMFQKVSRSFAVEFDELCSEIAHALSSGEARETVLIELLRKYLPARVGVDRGFVIDAVGGESRQIDVVIFDRTVGTVFEVSGVKYFPCESVIAVGEVKADVNSSEKLRDALEKLKSVKLLDRSNRGTNRIVTGPGISLDPIPFDPSKKHRDQIFGFIFTSGSLSRETTIDELRRFNGQNCRQAWMNLYFNQGRFLISYETGGNLSPSAMDAKFLYCTLPEEVPDLLLLFYCILATFVDEAHVARPNYFSYGEIGATRATYHELTLDETNLITQMPRTTTIPERSDT